MGKIIVTEFISLDGVMEDPGGAEDFKYGGWSFKTSRGAEGDAFKADETKNTEALLLGRTTYAGFAKAWPTITGEFADMFNGLPKYVVSQSKDLPEWPGGEVTALTGDLNEEITALKAKVEGNLVIHGSAMLVQGLLTLGLVDEIRLMVYPVVLGMGKKLFGDTENKQEFRLAQCESIGDGVALLVYAKD